MTCNDNRFELIEKYKNELLESTNIADFKEETDVIDSILFRFWQMGWLDKLEQFDRQKEEIEDLEIKNEHLVCFLAEARKDAIKEFAERLKKDLCDLEFNANTERKTIRVSELREQVDWVLHTVFIEIIDNRANEMTREQGNDRLPVDKKNGSRN